MKMGHQHKNGITTKAHIRANSFLRWFI